MQRTHQVLQTVRGQRAVEWGGKKMTLYELRGSCREFGFSSKNRLNIFPSHREKPWQCQDQNPRLLTLSVLSTTPCCRHQRREPWQVRMVQWDLGTIGSSFSPSEEDRMKQVVFTACPGECVHQDNWLPFGSDQTNWNNNRRVFLTTQKLDEWMLKRKNKWMD